jgi:hypothetical protein
MQAFEILIFRFFFKGRISFSVAETINIFTVFCNFISSNILFLWQNYCYFKRQQFI